MLKKKRVVPLVMASASYWVMVTQAQAGISADVMALSKRCAPDVHPVTMAYVVNHESSNNPYAIGINDGQRLSQQPASKDEAIAIAERLYAEGRSFDSGLGQIHSGNLRGLGLSVTDIFDPCQNLRAAAVILEGCYERAGEGGAGPQTQLRRALSCYNTNSLSRGFSNGYVERVTQQLAYTVPALVPMEAGSVVEHQQLDHQVPQPDAAPGSAVESAPGGDVFDRARPDAFASEPISPQESTEPDDKRVAGKAFIDEVLQVSSGRD